MNKKYWDTASGIGILVLAVALLIGSTRIKSLDVSRFGSGFFPAVVAAMLLILGIAILAGGIKQAKGPDEKAGEGADKPRSKGVLATFGLMIAYAALLPVLGFILMTMLYLFLQMLILSSREKRSFALFGFISVATSLIVYFTFVKVFRLMLPAGILG